MNTKNKNTATKVANERKRIGEIAFSNAEAAFDDSENEYLNGGERSALACYAINVLDTVESELGAEALQEWREVAVNLYLNYYVAAEKRFEAKQAKATRNIAQGS